MHASYLCGSKTGTLTRNFAMIQTNVPTHATSGIENMSFFAGLRWLFLWPQVKGHQIFGRPKFHCPISTTTCFSNSRYDTKRRANDNDFGVRTAWPCLAALNLCAINIVIICKLKFKIRLSKDECNEAGRSLENSGNNKLAKPAILPVSHGGTMLLWRTA